MSYKKLFVTISLLLVCKLYGENAGEIQSTKKSIQIEMFDKYQQMYFSINGIDSIAKADYIFTDYTIDSVFVSKLTFDAVYLKCFKGVIHENNFTFLKNNDPEEYSSIIQIHTAHLVAINGMEYPFEGKGDIGCWSTIPKNTKVSIESKVYSLFSNNIHIGKLIILESITPIK